MGRSDFIGLPERSFARGEWPDGPNKPWLESLERPDNHMHPERRYDPKSLFWQPVSRRYLVRMVERRVDPDPPGENRQGLLAQRPALPLPFGGYDPVFRAAERRP